MRLCRRKGGDREVGQEEKHKRMEEQFKTGKEGLPKS